MSSREQELDKLIALKATKVIDQLTEETQKEQEQKIREAAGRGILHSGSTVKMIMDLAVKRMDGAIRARYQAFKEVYESEGLLTADRLKERGKKEAAYFTSGPITGHINSNNSTKGMIPPEALERMVSSEVEKSKTKFLRDAEIDALEVHKAPSRSAISEVVKPSAFPVGHGNSGAISEADRKTVFLVHGHDEGAKEAVARHLEKHGMTVTILHEQPDGGKTIVEKFEHHSKVPFAVILATADDVGYPKNEPAKEKARPRQNVVLEMGYFLGALGRNRVFVLLEDGVEMPSDYSGVLYISFPHNSWRERLVAELSAAGADIK